MKVDSQILTYMETVIATAKMIGVEKIIIEPGQVRGIDEAKTVFILHSEGVPNLPFGSIGLNRIDVLASRIALAKSSSSYTLEVTPDNEDDPQYARSLTMKGKGLKVEYRCARPSTMTIPKKMDDQPKFTSTLTADAVSLLQKAAGAMETDELYLIGSEDSVMIELQDVSGDKLTTVVGKSTTLCDPLDESDVYFCHKYPIKPFHILFKATQGGSFEISSKGIIRALVNNVSVSILPRKE